MGTSRGLAAGATWIVRGAGRGPAAGCDVDRPWGRSRRRRGVPRGLSAGAVAPPPSSPRLRIVRGARSRTVWGVVSNRLGRGLAWGAVLIVATASTQPTDTPREPSKPVSLCRASAEYPRGSRGGAATRPRTIHV